jgi:cytochrome subunit of sulfide dehydrogenase
VLALSGSAGSEVDVCNKESLMKHSNLKPRAWMLGLAWAVAALPAHSQGLPAFDTPGRLLASNCYQCHGTNGRNGAWERLAGMSAREIVEEMNEMKAERVGTDIMKQHARGYTAAQIQQIAEYLSKVPR